MKANKKLTFFLVSFAIVSVLFYVGTFAFAYKNYETAGTFGDAFGFANAFFSGGALVMLIYAVILQRDELAVIKEERDDTRKLLSGQERINALQEEALKKQIFEQSFNSLLKMVVDEKSRLLTVEQIGPNAHVSQLSLAAQSARAILRDGLFAFRNDVNERNVARAEQLFRMMVHLDDFIAGSPLEAEAKSRRKALLRGIMDQELARCFACRMVISKQKEAHDFDISSFLREFGVFELLNAEDLSNFDGYFAN